MELERNWNNSDCIRVYNFRKSVNFKTSQESALIKSLKFMKLLSTVFRGEKPNFSANFSLILSFIVFKER